MISPHHIAAIPGGPSSHRGRFSDGRARPPRSTTAERVGSFADGLARRPDERWGGGVGSFADGLARRPNAATVRRIGHFSDGLGREGVNRRVRPGVDSRSSTEEGRIAA